MHMQRPRHNGRMSSSIFFQDIAYQGTTARIESQWLNEAAGPQRPAGSDPVELGFWIENAATGTSGVRSAVNRNIWRLFSEHDIAIPLAQREVRIVGNLRDAVPQPVTTTATTVNQADSAR